MIDLKKDIITKYVRHLTNLKCKFKIIEEDGTEHGELEVVVHKPNIRARRTNVIGNVDYKTPLLAMKPGDIISLECPANLPIESLRSSIAGFSCTNFGVGAVTTTLDRDTNSVIVLRVE